MVEVVEAATDRQVLAPPVGIAFERNAAPRVDLADAASEIATLPPMFGKHWQGRDVQRQGAVFVVLEVETHGQRCFHFDAFDVGELRAITQAALGHQ